MAQERTTGMIPMETKRTRLPLQGLNPMAAAIGTSMERTIPALFVLVKLTFFGVLILTGAGLNILGRIRMPEISRINTRISLTPVKVFSFVLGGKSSYISKIDDFVNPISKMRLDLSPLLMFFLPVSG